MQLDWLVNFIKEHASDDNKIVVFFKWLPTFDKLVFMLKEAGIGYSVIRGGQSENERTISIRNFARVFNVMLIQVRFGKQRNSSNCVIACSCVTSCLLLAMVMQVLVGGEALNLQFAKTVVNLTPAWNPSVEAQAVGRVYRRGQKHDVEYIKLVMKDSVDHYCLHIQDGKLDALEEVSDAVCSSVGLLMYHIAHIMTCLLLLCRYWVTPPQQCALGGTSNRTG